MQVLRGFGNLSVALTAGLLVMAAGVCRADDVRADQNTAQVAPAETSGSPAAEKVSAGATPVMPETSDSPLLNYRVVRNLEYARPDEKPLHLDAYLPKGDGPFPAVLVVHGGAWRFGSKVQLAGYAIALANRGFAAFAINYRLAPQHRFPAQIEDCRAAVKWIRDHAREYDVDPARIGATGYSAGGHLVALLGATPGAADHKGTGIQCVVAGGAPCDFRSAPENSRGLAFWLGDSRAKVPDAYRAASPIVFVNEKSAPMFFFGGDADRLVPPDTARAMVKALQAARVDAAIEVIKGASHLQAAMNGEALEHGWKFLEEHLKKK